jgi:hypothetical protein
VNEANRKEKKDFDIGDSTLGSTRQMTVGQKARRSMNWDPI